MSFAEMDKARDRLQAAIKRQRDDSEWADDVEREALAREVKEAVCAVEDAGYWNLVSWVRLSNGMVAATLQSMETGNIRTRDLDADEASDYRIPEA